MKRLSETDKFELWESNNLELYYRISDVGLHTGFITEAVCKIQKFIEGKTPEDFDVKAMQNTMQNLKEKFEKLKRSINDIESTMESICS